MAAFLPPFPIFLASSGLLTGHPPAFNFLLMNCVSCSYSFSTIRLWALEGEVIFVSCVHGYSSRAWQSVQHKVDAWKCSLNELVQPTRGWNVWSGKERSVYKSEQEQCTLGCAFPSLPWNSGFSLLSYGKVRPKSLLEHPMETPEAKKRVLCKPEGTLGTEDREEGETEVLAKWKPASSLVQWLNYNEDPLKTNTLWWFYNL